MEMGIQYTKYAVPPKKNSSTNSIASTIYIQIDSTRSVLFKLWFQSHWYIAKIHSTADLKGVIHISFVMPSPAEVGSDLTTYRFAGKREQHSFNWCHHIVYGNMLSSCPKRVSTCCTMNIPYPDFIHSALTTLYRRYPTLETGKKTYMGAKNRIK